MNLKQLKIFIKCIYFRLRSIFHSNNPRFTLSIADIKRFSMEFLCNDALRFKKDIFELPHDDYVVLVVAKRILQHFFGEEWVKTHVFGNMEDETFFHIFRRDSENAYKLQDRLSNVAESVLNLQYTPGFEHWIDSAKDRVDIEAAVAELMGARLLYQAGVDFSFIKPSGQPDGANYDLEIHLGSGSNVPCEMKCKIEDTEISRQTIDNTLKKARSQLPKVKVGIVFIRVPESWTRISNSQHMIELTIHSALKRTGRIAFVILHWEEWRLLPNGHAIRIDKFWPIINRHVRRNLKELDNIMSSMKHGDDQKLQQAINRKNRIDVTSFREDFVFTEGWRSLHDIINYH